MPSSKREIVSERTRDKIAAAGSGRPLILGYRVDRERRALDLAELLPVSLDPSPVIEAYK